MSGIRIIARALPAALAATLASMAARPAAAQERVLFSWQGRVDREASFTMQGSRVASPNGWPRADARGDLRVEAALPQADGVVRLRIDRGRGAVDVIEQPSTRNDYTAVVRVRDDQPGAGDYRVTAYWLPAGGSVARGGGWDGRGDDGRRDRGDGRWDRGDRPDRRRDRDERGRDRDARRADRRRDRHDDRGDRRRRDGWGWGARDGRSDANASGALRWSGRVDAVQEIRIRGRRVDSYTVSGDRAENVRSRVRGGLPAREAYVRVRQAEGRGQVAVVQQPSARNDYTAVLRVVDRQPGADYYTVEATW